MPFTFSHPAVVLPFFWLKKHYFSITGLVAGSIVPDFEYFIRMKKGISFYSHTIAGLFWFNLPLSLVLIFLFHEVVRKPFVNHLPLFILKRVQVYTAFEWKPYFKANWVVVMLSVIIGASLHLVWDELTHASADYVYERQHHLFFFSSWQHHSVIYTLVHLAHSLLGILLLAVVFYRLPIDKTAAPKRRLLKYWFSVGLVTAIVFFIRYLFSHQLSVEDRLVSLIAAFLLAIVVASLLAKKQPKLRE